MLVAVISVPNVTFVLAHLCVKLSGGGATRPLPRDRGVEELHGDPTVGPRSTSTKETTKGTFSVFESNCHLSNHTKV